LQFVCVESFVTALVDMYPNIFRKKNRREALIVLISILSYLVGLVMLTEVFWAQTTCVVLAGPVCPPQQRRGGLAGGGVRAGAESRACW